MNNNLKNKILLPFLVPVCLLSTIIVEPFIPSSNKLCHKDNCQSNALKENKDFQSITLYDIELTNYLPHNKFIGQTQDSKDNKSGLYVSLLSLLLIQLYLIKDRINNYNHFFSLDFFNTVKLSKKIKNQILFFIHIWSYKKHFYSQYFSKTIIRH